MARLRIGVLISGRGSNLRALIAACSAEAYPAEIALRAARADRMIKGRLTGDAWDELALLAAELCGQPPSSRSTPTTLVS